MSVGSHRPIRVGLIGYGLGGRVFHAPLNLVAHAVYGAIVGGFVSLAD